MKVLPFQKDAFIAFSSNFVAYSYYAGKFNRTCMKYTRDGTDRRLRAEGKEVGGLVHGAIDWKCFVGFSC